MRTEEAGRPRPATPGAPTKPSPFSVHHGNDTLNPPRSHGEWLTALVAGGWLRRLSWVDQRVLLALAAHAHRHGQNGSWVAWPRVETLAEEAGTSAWRVSRALSRLEAHRLVSSAGRFGGRGRATEWRIWLPPGASLATPETPTPRMGVSGTQTPTRRVSLLAQNPHPRGAKRVTLRGQPGVAETQAGSGFRPISPPRTKEMNQENTAAQQDPASTFLGGVHGVGASPLRDSGGACCPGGAQGTQPQPATPVGGRPAEEGDPPTGPLTDGEKRGPAKGRARRDVAGPTQAPARRTNPAADTARELAARWGIPRDQALRAVTAAAKVAGIGMEVVRHVVEHLPPGPAPEEPVSRLVAICRSWLRRRTDLEEAVATLERVGVSPEKSRALGEYLLSRGLGPGAVERLAAEARIALARCSIDDLWSTLRGAPADVHGWDAWRWLAHALRARAAGTVSTEVPPW